MTAIQGRRRGSPSRSTCVEGMCRPWAYRNGSVDRTGLHIPYRILTGIVCHLYTIFGRPGEAHTSTPDPLTSEVARGMISPPPPPPSPAARRRYFQRRGLRGGGRSKESLRVSQIVYTRQKERVLAVRGGAARGFQPPVRGSAGCMGILAIPVRAGRM